MAPNKALWPTPAAHKRNLLGLARISAETAVLLAKYFGNSAPFWLGLQIDCDLEEARKRLHTA